MIARSSLRALAHHRWQLALAVGGIALGVAVAVGMDLATRSARAAFALSRGALSSSVSHEIVGGPLGVRDDVVAHLRGAPVSSDRGVPLVGPGAEPTFVPLVEEFVPLAQPSDETVHLLGVDLLEAPTGRAGWTLAAPSPELLTALLVRPGTALVAAPLARRHGWRAGSQVALRLPGRVETSHLRVVGTFALRAGDGADGGVAERASRDLVVVDLATAQELLDRVGWLSRIEVLPPSFTPSAASAPDWVRRLHRRLPPSVRLLTVGQEVDGLEALTRALHLNLTALSLLALLVGAFLVYNTMAFVVVRRRPLIASLRTLGVTRGELLLQLQLEVLGLGLVGTLLGLAGGVGLARGLVRLVSRTIDDLYFVHRASAVTLSPWSLTWGLALGLVATQLAALGPVAEAVAVAPRAARNRSLFEQTWGRRVARFAKGGAGLLVCGVAAAVWPSRALGLGFVSVLTLLLGGAFVSPWLVSVALAPLARPLGRLVGPVGRLACRGVSASMSRTAVAIAALVITVAATIGVEVMVRSFRSTVERWLEVTLAADIYVSPPARPGAQAISSGAVQRVRAIAGVARMDTHRGVTLVGSDGPVQVAAIEVDPRTPPPRRLPLELLYAGDDPWGSFESGQGVFLSESYAYRKELRVGDGIWLPTDRGGHRFTVVAVHRDFGSPAGTVMMSRHTYARHWDDPGSSSLAIYVAPPGGSRAEERIMGRVRGELAAEVHAEVRSNRSLRQLSLGIFDRTFAITQVLRLLTAFVAVAGLFGALLGLALDRGRELAVLRAVGLTQGQLWGLVGLQNGLLGLAAGLLAVPLGIALAAVLTYVIDRRSFGWTLELSISPGAIVQLVLLSVGAAVVAGIYPSWRMARTSPALALRDE